jgi:hypothetical protein
MFRKSLLLLAFACIPVMAVAPLKLIFSKGEVMKYRVNIDSTESTSLKGDTFEMKVSGSHLMTLTVASVSGGVASMSVKYSNAAANATALSLPPEAKKDKAKIEQNAEKALKAALLSGARSQKVRSNGSATYTLSAGEGQSLSIEGGAFMMLVLPSDTPTLNKVWSANIRQPMPGAPALPCKFKWVGNVTKNGRTLRKITIQMTQSKSNKKGDVSISVSETAIGHILFDAAKGKVIEGEVQRTAKQTLKHVKEGTRTQTQVSKQTFVKV